ncbi:MAG: gfo/Idh/MocA family oxidoreductase, partial [Candidatus Sulfotelmatobacter sp.]
MKILIVGLGGIGQRHLRNLRTLLGDDVDILAYRVRKLSQVITPTLQVDADRDVERDYHLRVFG